MHTVSLVIHKTVNSMFFTPAGTDCQELINRFVENKIGRKPSPFLLVSSVINIRIRIRNLRAVDYGRGLHAA